MTAGEITTRSFLESMRHALREVVHFVRAPQLEVTLVLPATARTGDAAPTTRASADAISRAVSAAADGLGIQVQPVVEVAFSTGTAVSTGTARGPAFTFGGRPVRLPADLGDALAARSEQDAWPRPDHPRWPDALATVCRVLVERDPRILLGPLQREMLVLRAREAGLADYDDALLAAALGYVVGHGVSLRDLAPLNAALKAQDDVVETAGEFAEVAIETLRPDSIEIRLNPSTLRRTTASGVEQNAFVDVRRRLFARLGVKFPDIDLVAAADVPEGACALRLNHVELQPRPLPDGATVADVALFAERWLHRYAPWFVSLADVRSTVEDLKLALPELVGIVQERHSYPRLTLLTRALVEERVPVRNVGRLMVLLLDAPPAGTQRGVVNFAEPLRGTATENPGAQCPRQLVSYARQLMSEEAARQNPGVVTVRAACLPPDLDATLSAVPTLDG
ncbi:MAG TPA: hypothetical protein VF657_19190, partial [Actinoplanes sp.]